MTLRVVDDGIGIDENVANNEGVGLRLMAYRAEMIHGELSVGEKGKPPVAVREVADPALAMGSVPTAPENVVFLGPSSLASRA